MIAQALSSMITKRIHPVNQVRRGVHALVTDYTRLQQTIPERGAPLRHPVLEWSASLGRDILISPTVAALPPRSFHAALVALHLEHHTYIRRYEVDSWTAWKQCKCFR